MRAMVVAAALALAGCATPQPLPPVSSPAVSPEAAQVAVRAYLQTILRNPQAARIEFIGAPVPYSNRFPSVHEWVQCAWVNGQNGFGGMTGDQVYMFVFSGGRRQTDLGMAASVQTHWVADGSSFLVDEMVGEACVNAAFPANASPVSKP